MKRQQSNSHRKALADRKRVGRFETGGENGPITDPAEYEAFINDVADPEKREFLEQQSRFATTWQYLESRNMQLPFDISEEIASLKDGSLTVRDRICRMQLINKRLAEFIHQHDHQSSAIRQ